jgi:hypothetical protein
MSVPPITTYHGHGPITSNNDAVVGFTFVAPPAPLHGWLNVTTHVSRIIALTLVGLLIMTAAAAGRNPAKRMV